MLDIAAISQHLVEAEDGIWYANAQTQVSYPNDGHDVCLAVEDGSFWFRHRNRCIAAAVQRLPPAAGGAIFDIGGGNGCVAGALTQAGFDVVLVEPAYSGARNARRRGLSNVVCATTDSAGFKPESMAAAGLFDVIEHVQDDHAFVGAMATLLTTNGRLYVTVPAYGWLWSHEDVQAGHFRRYTLTSICEVLCAAGLRIEYASYFFRVLPLPIALARALPYRLGHRRTGDDAASIMRDHAPGSSATLQIVERLLGGETDHIASGRRMHFGGSCLLVAQKP
jgi:2-polyprenyl-3-methyl-5-hydroxy-6-metoxy-1,4-benzoquinol methylase